MKVRISPIEVEDEVNSDEEYQEFKSVRDMEGVEGMGSLSEHGSNQIYESFYDKKPKTTQVNLKEIP